MNDKDYQEIFQKFLKEANSIGISMDDRKIDHLKKYIDLILEWMEIIRLVGTKNKEEILWLHVMDSFYAEKFIDINDTVLDIGSGAGFPGVPIRIVRPDVKVTLVESSRKKANFLKEVKRVLEIENLVVVEGRFEEMTKGKRFHSVISRAVMEPIKWISVADKFIKNMGKILVMLGNDWEENNIVNNCEKRNLFIEDRLDYIIPIIEHRRSVLKIRKRACFT